MTNTEMTATHSITVYWDTQDPANVGWAYRASRDGQEVASGALEAGTDADAEDLAKDAAEDMGWEDQDVRCTVYVREDSPVVVELEPTATWWDWHDADQSRWSASMDEAEERARAWARGESDDGPAR